MEVRTQSGGYLLAAAALSLVALCSGSADEKRLVKHLLENYSSVGRVGRPVLNSTDPARVNISFGLIELQNFDIENQRLDMVGWTALEWIDPFLRWSSDDFSGIEELSVEKEEIWAPDIILTNALSKPDPIHETRVHVTSEGQVTWTTTYKYNFYCKIASEDMDSDMFPCSLRFASWSMPSNMLDLKNKRERFDANYYVPNREWEFYKNKAKRQEVELPWGNRMWSAQVVYEFTLKRRIQINQEDLEESSAAKVKVTGLLLLPVWTISFLISRAHL